MKHRPRHKKKVQYLKVCLVIPSRVMSNTYFFSGSNTPLTYFLHLTQSSFSHFNFFFFLFYTTSVSLIIRLFFILFLYLLKGCYN